MKALIQRVKNASVSVKEETVGKIETGLCVLAGIEPTDTLAELSWMANKLTTLRIFEDEAGKMNKNLTDINASALIISQFTLLADCMSGRRPSFTGAGNPETAKALFHQFTQLVSAQNIPVQTGVFGAEMVVTIVNDGPATFMLESPKK